MIAVGQHVLFMGKRRRVTGVKGAVVHFAQVIKLDDGSNVYWALAHQVEVVF